MPALTTNQMNRLLNCQAGRTGRVQYRVRVSLDGRALQSAMTDRSRPFPRSLPQPRWPRPGANRGHPLRSDHQQSRPLAASPTRPISSTGLADPRGLGYAPDPRGPMVGARSGGRRVRPLVALHPTRDRVVLTASTSEAYGFLFRLFCDPGEAVLVPSPSYPLFEHLARLDAVEALTYDLDGDADWRIRLFDPREAARTCSGRGGRPSQQPDGLLRPPRRPASGWWRCAANGTGR